MAAALPCHTQEQLVAMKSKVAGAMFSCRVEVTHPTLRSLMGLKEGELVFHDVQVGPTFSPPYRCRMLYLIRTSVAEARRKSLAACCRSF